MVDQRIVKMAQVIVDFCLEAKAGELILVRAGVAAAPLVLEIYRCGIQREAHVETQLTLPGQEEALLRYGNEEQLRFVSPLQEVAYRQYDCIVRIMSETNTRSLTHIDPARLAVARSAQGRLGQIMMQRTGKGSMRRCATLYPTEAYAQDAGMSLQEYEDFVFEACRITEPDPIAAWYQQRDMQARLIEWLTPRREVHIRGLDTDLTMSIEGRQWVNSFGRANFPSGEIFTGPQEATANGTIRFTYPASVGGQEIEDVRLWFEDGRVVQATAARNERYLHQMLDTDEGARYLGELGIGANFGIQQFTKNTLYDEKIGGTVHLALGRSYPETGGTNQSIIHWDLVCDLRQGGEVRVDGEVLAKDGRFIV